MEKNIRILVTGANGQLGRSFQNLAPLFPEYAFHFFTREEFPIDDAGKATEIISAIQPAFLINCAAYTAVDKAESEKAAADRINAEAPGMLANLCTRYGARMIHISTDYVFNGNGQQPYLEIEATDPVNSYGAGKLLGEQLVQAASPLHFIIRTSWVYAPFGHNFVKTMLRLMNDRPEIGVVSDQRGTPTYAPDLAEAIVQMVKVCLNEPGKTGGMYHFSNSGETTWHGFAQQIATETKSACKVNPIPTSAFPTPAKRPSYSVLSKEKIAHDFGIVLKPWEESLRTCLKEMNA